MIVSRVAFLALMIVVVCLIRTAKCYHDLVDTRIETELIVTESERHGSH